ncbi:hypothetical protein EMPG_17059 [Blastomyces silverae]|uniref:Uncharacterized protein n=1 Tax=Blastomyces silverae TaxID=2060906 RepID=A0A0H1B7V1_9EURO|nr:hypothetical protein EMPG_17059 [Blastomyces silverae]
MKATTLLAAALAALAGGASGKIFVPVDLPPPGNWVPGPSLWPNRVLAGFNAAYSDFTLSAWINYMQNQCNQVSGCTSLSLASGKDQNSY